MLAPGDRELLTALLQPPEGYRMDEAVGTTFSLDLVALLTIPLAFAAAEWDEPEDVLARPELLLHGLRQGADRISVFCERGRVAAPRTTNPLVALLEETVCEVRAPHKGGVFHPKIWLIRYAPSDQGNGELPILYRFLCLSRNLTFDASWDIVLRLDGVLENRVVGFSANRPIADFLLSLPDLARKGVGAQARARIERLAGEVRRVRFELPEGVERMAFHPIGLRGSRMDPFPQYARQALIVSPFLTDDGVLEIADRVDVAQLVAREEELVRISPDTLAEFESVFTLAPAEPVDQEGEVSEAPLSGLHAKLYIFEEGATATVLLGSANATTAAQKRNVEFLVELEGHRKGLGIKAVLDGTKEGGKGLGKILTLFTPPDTPFTRDPQEVAAEEALEGLRRLLADAGLELHVGAPDSSGWHSLALHSPHGSVELPKDIAVRVWPVTKPPAQAVALGRSWPAALGVAPTHEVTSFVAFELRHAGQKVPAVRFVLNLPVVGAPQNRRETVIRSILDDPQKVLRFIRFLLSGEEGWFIGGDGTGGSWNGAWAPWESDALLEPLLKALRDDPRRLDSVESLLKELSVDGKEPPVPPGFEAVWGAIWEARLMEGTK